MDITPTTVALPFALVWLLTLGMQAVKPLLEQYVPLFAVTSTSHDNALRTLYGVVAFAAILAYALLTIPNPTTVDGWIAFVAGIVVAAQGVTGLGHLTYKGISNGGSSQPAQPSDPAPGDFPPGAPSLAALGLPSEADSADVSEQDTAVSLPVAA